MPDPRPALATLAILASPPSVAELCSANIDDVVFGSVDVLNAGSPLAEVTATLQVDCTGGLLEGNGTVTACLSLDAGSGGWDAGQRYLDGPSGTLAYNLYADAAHTQVIGADGAPFGDGPLRIEIPITGALLGLIIGSGSASVPLHARLFGGQDSAAVGGYTSLFGSGSDARMRTAFDASGLVDCASADAVADPNGFNVNASVVPACEVSADDLHFGSQVGLDTPIDASGELNITCTTAADYSIALGPGLHADTGRRLRLGSGEHYVTYGLYRDPARSLPWGSGSGLEAAGSGSGTAQTWTVYGRVPAQPTPPPGLYTDTVVVTVGF